MVYRLIGGWELGLAFDLHTVTSTYLGPNQFESHPINLLEQLKSCFSGEFSFVEVLLNGVVSNGV